MNEGEAEGVHTTRAEQPKPRNGNLEQYFKGTYADRQ